MDANNPSLPPGSKSRQHHTESGAEVEKQSASNNAGHQSATTQSPHGFGGASWPAPGQGFTGAPRSASQTTKSVGAFGAPWYGKAGTGQSDEDNMDTSSVSLTVRAANKAAAAAARADPALSSFARDTPQQSQAQPPPPHPASAKEGAMESGKQNSGMGMRELKVEDALCYLDDVKREFKDRPSIYNEFLSIMKNFKTQDVDTPGVINRVSRLFRGYNKLILGFNAFLPLGYQIRPEDLQRQEAEEARKESAVAAERAAEEAAQAAPPAAPPPVKVRSKPAPARKQATLPTVQSKAKQTKSAKPASKASPSAVRSSPVQAKSRSPAPQQPGQQHQAVEFDHAILYVTKIKRRFSNDPTIYHQFLEILHNYQREQRGIKEVLEQVAHLFQDHSDLLKEFTFFLPDAVQEQAKERLHRAAAESENRKRQAEEEQQRENQRKETSASTEAAPSIAASPKLIDMTRAQQEEASRKRGLDEPESYVYNSAVERQFFDATKESLTAYTRDGGQAWAEFLKCLDMYAQEILSRQEMLNIVEPLLGKRHTKLFEEFKRILAAAGSPRPTEESWYSVPLAEIDFSRCRRCTPSYRALPRDYPAHPCSDRTAEEKKVLNDIWVSLPVGSEESYTFRHMRRNTHEEALFRVEDERFEIDMVIDSNAATLQRLMPVAEEIALLAKDESPVLDAPANQADSQGLGSKNFQYWFDSSILGVIHRNTVVRIYGDSGQEMLELMSKNPTVAIPAVVQRLQQKDREWRLVRDRLNRHWRELAEQNYYKSLDHRGLTWRTIDKRATSTRTMITELKDRASNGGNEGGEALKQKMDKAKEEHGAFFEITMGDTLSPNLDLTLLPKPDRRIFTPHLSLLYRNNSWVQRDVFRLLAFALERGPISPGDKERCHRLWVEFLGPWFDLSLNWMLHPAVSYQDSAATATKVTPSSDAPVVSEDDEDESLDGGGSGNRMASESSDSSNPDHHPLPPETVVSTVYGEGKIIGFRNSDRIYVVKLDGCGAKGYLRPSSILCSLLPVAKSAYTRQLREADRTRLARPGEKLAFGTQSLYLFFRLHQILVQRLNTAKKLAYSVDDDSSLVTLVERMPNDNRNAIGRARYEAYLSLVYALLDGGVGGASEGGKYEDRVRSLLGHGAYELATIDKLISHIWKNLQALAGDETMWNLIQLYRRHQEAGSFHPEAFRQEASYLSDGEVMYAFQHCPVSGKDESVLYTELVGVMDDEDEQMEEVDEPVVEPSSKRQRR